jgi:hypothetical protein
MISLYKKGKKEQHLLLKYQKPRKKHCTLFKKIWHVQGKNSLSPSEMLKEYYKIV